MIAKKYAVIFLFVACLHSLLVTACFAQNWTNYNQDNSGLNNNAVTSITVDTNDIVWIGASNGCAFPYGLNRFDGTSWVHYDHTNSGLVSDAVWRVLSDFNNNLWITYYCGEGLTKFDGTNWITYDTSNSNIPSNLINDLFIDSSNEVWTAGNGIAKFNGTSFTTYYTLPSNEFFTTLYADSNVIYAVGENLGLYKYDTSAHSVMIYDNSNSNIPSMYFGSISKDHNGLIWLGSNYGFTGSTGGIATFDGNTFTAINPFTSASTWVGYDQGIAIDQSNNIWVATRCEGLYVFDGITWVRVGANLPQDGCAGFVYTDHQNRIWYGDVYSGVWTNIADVGIADKEMGLLKIYPSPTIDVVNISLPNLESMEGTVEVYDARGEKISERLIGKGSNKLEMDISVWTKGIYYVHLISNDKTYAAKIMKQ